MYQLSPSILAADFNCLGEQIRQVEEAGVEWLHIDVMDGAFVPSISFGMPVIASIRKNSSLFFDVHLMIEEPGRYIEEFKKSGADMLTVHAEACKHLECVLDLVDMVLVMTVNPGFGGQSYIESCTGKVQKLRKMITDAGLDVDIQVDGGINEKTIDKVLDAGANILVAGSAVFGGNIGENVRCLKEKMESR